MQVELIHPYDLCAMLMGYGKYLDVTRTLHGSAAYHDDILEIDGKLYLQSIRVEPKTKNIV